MTRGKQRARRLWIWIAPRSFLRACTPTRAELGLAGEEIAARWLRQRGFRMLGRRLRTPHAEVDLWATDGHKAWVIEVKTGRDGPAWHAAEPTPGRWRWRPGDSLKHAQLERLSAASRHLARRLRMPAGLALLEVCVPRNGASIEVFGQTLETPQRRSEFQDP